MYIKNINWHLPHYIHRPTTWCLLKFEKRFGLDNSYIGMFEQMTVSLDIDLYVVPRGMWAYIFKNKWMIFYHTYKCHS